MIRQEWTLVNIKFHTTFGKLGHSIQILLRVLMQETEHFLPLSECLRTLEMSYCSKTLRLQKAESEGIFAYDQSMSDKRIRHHQL